MREHRPSISLAIRRVAACESKSNAANNSFHFVVLFFLNKHTQVVILNLADSRASLNLIRLQLWNKIENKLIRTTKKRLVLNSLVSDSMLCLVPDGKKESIGRPACDFNMSRSG